MISSHGGHRHTPESRSPSTFSSGLGPIHMPLALVASSCWYEVASYTVSVPTSHLDIQ